MFSETQDDPIHVTKSFLPPRQKFDALIDKVWENSHLTNNGPLLKEFELAVKACLDVDNFQFVSNGTIALQVALEALVLREGDIITTPFSYVATTSSILWQRCRPVFVDIDEETLNIDPSKIEAAITENTRAIMPVHVFGNPCDIEAIEGIAKKHNLKVIYDGAHAFGVTYRGRSLLSYGDISTVSFHATKAFHTIEGGGVICKDTVVDGRVDLVKRFGHYGDEHYILGVNAKANEFQAAMGLAGLPYFNDNVAKRKQLSEYYDELTGLKVGRQKRAPESTSNYTYYPVIFENEQVLQRVVRKLESMNIFPRRYFYPSLNTLPYLTETQHCPIAEDISKRILCLPLHTDLNKDVIAKICEVITSE